MFMEDVLAQLAEGARDYLVAKDRQFVRSLYSRVQRGEPLTTRQGFAFLSLLTKTSGLRYELNMSEQQYDDMIVNAKWNNPLKPAVWLKNEVRYMGNSVLAFRCTPSKVMEQELGIMKAQYYGGVRLLHVAKARNLTDAIEFIGKHRFQMDEATEQWLAGALGGLGYSSSATVWEDRIIVDVPDDLIVTGFLISALRATEL